MVEAELRGWLPIMGVVLPEDQIHHVLEEAEHALDPYVTAEGRVTFDLPAHITRGQGELKRVAMLDAETLTAERQRFFIEMRGGVYFPIAGAIFWLLLGGTGFIIVGLGVKCGG